MTDDHALAVWKRLKILFGEPRPSHEATADLFTEWATSLEQLDYRLANAAITKMHREWTWQAFPRLADFLRYYKSEVGPQTTDSAGTSDSYNTIKFIDYRLRSLDQAEYAEIERIAKDRAERWCSENSCGFLLRQRAMYEMRLIAAKRFNIEFYDLEE